MATLNVSTTTLLLWVHTMAASGTQWPEHTIYVGETCLWGCGQWLLQDLHDE